jgi:hypothetical protein
MPISRAVRITRMAISPRLAINIFCIIVSFTCFYRFFFVSHSFSEGYSEGTFHPPKLFSLVAIALAKDTAKEGVIMMAKVMRNAVPAMGSATNITSIDLTTFKKLSNLACTLPAMALYPLLENLYT